MNKLPGTQIELGKNDPQQIISSLFEAGGLFLSQICTISGLEAHTVQNWVKRGFVSPPVKKLYSQRQFCRIITINMLRNVLPLDTALKLLVYINQTLVDESDDRIDDSVLYFKFCKMAIGNELSSTQARLLAKELSDDIDDADVRRRVRTALEAMYFAYASSIFKKKAEDIIAISEI